ncbi:MAG: DUF488 domain-containing protein [Sphaerochaetaceae bacterium]|jgi:uncharacterized protein YeaO (DUF488 family)
MNIFLKRAYDEISSDDGIRILVDRLWPQGISKESLKADFWLKELGPSNELRKWFNHDQSKWEEFKKSYYSELNSKEKEINQILEIGKNNKVTLLYASKEQRFNQAVALKEYLLAYKKDK